MPLNPDEFYRVQARNIELENQHLDDVQRLGETERLMVRWRSLATTLLDALNHARQQVDELVGQVRHGR